MSKLFITGVDPGSVYDPTAVCVLDSDGRIVHVERLSRGTVPQETMLVLAILKRFPGVCVCERGPMFELLRDEYCGCVISENITKARSKELLAPVPPLFSDDFKIAAALAIHHAKTIPRRQEVIVRAWVFLNQMELRDAFERERAKRLDCLATLQPEPRIRYIENNYRNEILFLGLDRLLSRSMRGAEFDEIICHCLITDRQRTEMEPFVANRQGCIFADEI